MYTYVSEEVEVVADEPVVAPAALRAQVREHRQRRVVPHAEVRAEPKGHDGQGLSTIQETQTQRSEKRSYLRTQCVSHML